MLSVIAKSSSRLVVSRNTANIKMMAVRSLTMKDQLHSKVSRNDEVFDSGALGKVNVVSEA